MAARPDRVAPVARDAATGALELELLGLEDVPDERAGARLELELRRGEGEVHRARMAHATGPRPRSVAGRGTLPSRAGRAP